MIEALSMLMDRMATKAFKSTNATPLIAIPNSMGITSMEKFEPHPSEKRGRVTAHSEDGMIGYVTAMGVEPCSRLYYTPTKRDSEGSLVHMAVFQAILDDHGEKPGHGAHLVTYKPTFSVNWAKWTASNGAMMRQADFAQFIEDNYPDIAEVEFTWKGNSGLTPSQADMLDLSTNLKVSRKAQYQEVNNLKTGGVVLKREEDVQANIAKSEREVPDLFGLRLPIFRGGPAVDVLVRFRFRQNDGELRLGYEIFQLDETEDAEVEAMVSRISTKTKLPAIEASFDRPGTRYADSI
ncbi:MAG: YfdQ family protein [Alphaproteobacteria bacterium]|nr:YfdQ family protein [Alphaproteobacteria bacterium]